MRNTLSSEAALGAMLNLPAMLMQAALGGIASAVGSASRGGLSGCGHSGHKHHSKGTWVANTDIKWKANEGETRVASMLVENNRSQPTVITLTAQPWIDATGTQVKGGNLIIIPAVLNLKAGESASVKLQVNVVPPLEAGMAYYTEIILGGCSRKPISVGLVVARAGFEMSASCDPCCGAKPRFIEICQECCCEPCRCGCECGETSKCSGCGRCGCSCECEPCSPWPGCWDPHHHWVDDCDCERIMIPRPPTINPGGTVGGIAGGLGQ